MSQSNSWVDRLTPASPDGPSSLAAERAGSNVDVDVLSEHLMGKKYLEQRERIVAILESEKLFSKDQIPNLSRPERYVVALARGKRMRQLQDEHKWSDEEHEIAKMLTDEMSPYQLNNTMFRQTLREQTNDEQRRYWLKQCEEWNIVGAYCQTELGHGSNVQGLETTATWDPKTGDFILHSPHLTSAKWWNGSLGRTANYGVVIAQLRLPDPDSPGGNAKFKSYGPHPFIVQLRDEKNHKPLPGIVVGDIGPKFGYAAMDNGYMLMNQVRVPHAALLARYSSVDPKTGAYHAPENRAVVYGSLTHARKRIVLGARIVLARATTIAIRYCAVRRQFRDKTKSKTQPETAVLDYTTVQIRLFPLLATAFALHYSGAMMDVVYNQTRSDVESKGDLSKLADLHSLSSGLKSLSTELATGGMEVCRRAMGGHGFGGASGLVAINSDYLSKPTVEGDNWMITQQMARYLIKKAKMIVANPGLTPSNRTEAALLRYWKQSSGPAPHFDIFSQNQNIVAAFEHRAAYLTFQAHKEMEVNKRDWNSMLVQLHNLSNAQSEAIMVYSFYDGLKSDNCLPAPTKEIVWHLFRLFAFYTMGKGSRDFERSGAVSSTQLDAATDGRILEIMREIRPHAVSLVDSWKLPDYLLNSALGRYDGRVYEDLFNKAHRLNPLNSVTANPNYRDSEIIKEGANADEILAKL